MTSNKYSAKDIFLDSGRRLMFKKGFHGMGINELLQISELSRGSFYHHFKSKEGFGVELLEDSYRACFSELENVFRVQSVDARRSCFMRWLSDLLEDSCAPLRLIALLNAEVDLLPDKMREDLLRNHEKALQLLTECIKLIYPRNIDCDEEFRPSANTLISLWMGSAITKNIKADISHSNIAHLSVASILICSAT
ncbi:TetR/AcrR family transcriptional repressor of nem operon [Pseudomonas fluvialis]|uniref:TetR/AcrR family transcriptional repressor of nem operon n=1 Tax=Pseudomonas fluvialis TaxID=1793966 RepID=A0A7X0ETE6_9PSED|nr:TetR/AcrR family transcriptional regulator [Pseudomonas fluvialis]MBB6340506.1 TetR/AcrR family transcriptional repressor of nem operon [Pseudomonas fluvialis]